MASKEIEAQVREWLTKNWDRYVEKGNPVPPGVSRDLAISVVMNGIMADPELVCYIRMLVELGGREAMLFCVECLAVMEFEGTPGLPFHTESAEDFFQHLLLVHDLKVIGTVSGGGFLVERVSRYRRYERNN